MHSPSRRSPSFRAFSLVEMVVVIVVIALLALIATVGFRAVIDRSEISTAVAQHSSLAREVSALLAFRDTTPSDALDAALPDMPAAASAPGVFAAEHPYTRVAADEPSTGPTVLSVDPQDDYVAWAVRVSGDQGVACRVESNTTTRGCWRMSDSFTGEAVSDPDGDADGDLDDDGGGPVVIPTTTTTTTPPGAPPATPENVVAQRGNSSLLGAQRVERVAASLRGHGGGLQVAVAGSELLGVRLGGSDLSSERRVVQRGEVGARARLEAFDLHGATVPDPAGTANVVAATPG